MLPSTIADAEGLFRAIPNRPQMWKPAENRPSSAAFKDERGTSVDRGGERTDDEVWRSLQSRRPGVFRALVSVTAGGCRSIGAYPVAEPDELNAYHAEIHDSETVATLGNSKAKRLAKDARVVVPW